MRALAPSKNNSIIRLVGHRLRAIMSHWRGMMVTGACMLGLGIFGAGASLVAWGVISCATLMNMSETIPLTSIR
ncbi:MAG TPA: hypothetical protein VLG09_04590 [Candidatus Saccharimonadales bacterium]|nr:hypothetical protein [Candidatus Saccharimonadales bacterium]